MERNKFLNTCFFTSELLNKQLKFNNEVGIAKKF